jgi:hypothetical protein
MGGFKICRAEEAKRGMMSLTIIEALDELEQGL